VSWTVLVNPKAGPSAVSVDRVRSALRAEQIEASIEMPTDPTEMQEAVAEAIDRGRHRVAVVGGDGTVNLAVNVLLAREWDRRPVLGILPAGTGCDLGRTFGLPQRLEEAAAHLSGEATYRIDIGRLEGSWGTRLFANVAQAGVGAAAAESAMGLPRWLGKARYPAAFAARLPGFKAGEIELSTEGRSYAGPALAVIFANGQFFAGGWNVAPRANMIDGRLDVQTFVLSKWGAPAMVPKIIRGVHLTNRAVRRRSVMGFELKTSHPWPIEADGDLVGNTPVKGSVLPLALDLKI
jgi:diacylglycerol kinase (ATP)